MILSGKRPGETRLKEFLGHLISFFFTAAPARKRSLLSLADQVTASANNFLTGMIIARACTKEEFGVYMLCFNFVMFIMDIQTSLISSPYMVYCQRLSAHERAKYTGSTMLHQVIFSVAVVLILLVMMTIFPDKFREIGIWDAFCVLTVSAMFMLFREFIRRLCFANLMMGAAIRLDLTVSLIQLSALAMLWRNGSMSADTAFVVIGVACAAASAIYLFQHSDTYRFNLSDFSPSFAKNFSFGGWMFGSTILWAASMSLYPWLLTWFHGPAAMGTWGACWGVAALANPLMVGIQNFLGPEIVKNYTDDGIIGLRWHIKRKTIIYLVAMAPIALGLILAGRYLVPLFYGSKYSDTGLIVAILGVHILVIAASYPVSRALIAIEQAKTYFLASFVPLLVTLSCGILLVYQLGPLGVALGTLLGTSVTAVAMALCFFRIATTQAEEADSFSGT